LLRRHLTYLQRLDPRTRQALRARSRRNCRQGYIFGQAIGKLWIELHTQTVQCHRDQLVLCRREQRLDDLLIGVLRVQRLPGRIADHRVITQFIDHTQQRAIEVGPASRLGSFGNSVYFGIGHSSAGLRNARVL
jgi:hypothetical protein